MPLLDAKQQMTTWVWASLKHCVISFKFSLSARAVVAPSNVSDEAGQEKVNYLAKRKGQKK